MRRVAVSRPPSGALACRAPSVYPAPHSIPTRPTMADHGVPHFHNDGGVTVIHVKVRELMCIGAKPPFDHPHVFLDMGSDDEIICPYCSTLFRYDPALKPGECRPADALWHDAGKAAA
jgi:uncharacterized Zn-finger protein